MGQERGACMSIHNQKTERPAQASCRPGLWQIFLPALVFIVLYSLLKSACVLMYRHLKASGPVFMRGFLAERPGLCMAAMTVFSMAAALFAVSGVGKRRLLAFRAKAVPAVQGESRRKGFFLRLCLILCACALCIFGNAQIQAGGLSSDSVYTMQPIYREVPFLFILLIFAVFTPFVEEFVFRGILYAGLRSRFSPLPSALLAAALFGLYHGELIQGTYAFLMGLFFCVSLEVTGDIRMPWLLHGICNGLPLILSYSGIWEIFLGRAWRIGTFACFLIAAGLSGALLVRKKAPSESRD